MVAGTAVSRAQHEKEPPLPRFTEPIHRLTACTLALSRHGWSSACTHTWRLAMKLRLWFAVVSLVVALPCAAADSPKAEINSVIARFQSALKQHDAKALDQLFLPDSDAWVTTLGDDTLKAMRNKHPDAPHYRVGKRKSFLDFVGSTKSPIEERFHDVRIDTDGSVASIYFTFEFLMDGQVQNRGAETWQLVKTDDGWKISAMLYSSNF
jgi:ketosteroid isomerase-like protein